MSSVTPKRHRATDRRGAVGYVFAFNDAETAKATEELTAYCAAQGLQLREVLVDTGNDGDAVARGLQERSSGSRFLGALLAEDDRRHLVVRKVDDLGTVKDLQLLLGVLGSRYRYLHVIKSRLTTEHKDATGKLLGTLVRDLARMIERELRALSTRSTLIPLMQGGVPYGWDRVGNRLVINPHQLAVRKQAREWLEAGKSLREVAALLNEAGELSKQGRPWNQRSVGDLRYSKTAERPDNFRGSHIHDESLKEYLRRGELLRLLAADPEGCELLKKVQAKQRDAAERREIDSLAEPVELSWEQRRQRMLGW